MGLIRNFKVATDEPNRIALNWDMPLSFNLGGEEVIITKTSTHFPMELFNSDFPNKATDSRPIEIFKGSTIVGLNTATISVNGNTLTDTSATFPTSPILKGRLLRDSSSKVYRILSNTSTSVTVDTDDTITNGKYVVLADFPTTIRPRDNFELDLRTEVGPGFIRNLVVYRNNSLIIKTFIPGELANLVFVDGNNNKFLIRDNTESTIILWEGSIAPVIGSGMMVLESFFNSSPMPYLDTFKTAVEASTRVGTGLLDDKWYYYTGFTKPTNTNVAQAEFSVLGSGNSTQGYALSAKDSKLGEYLYSLWPEIHRSMDETEDLQDLMEVFGFQFNEIHSLINTYKLQDSENVVVTALLPLSEQTGLPAVGYSIGIDTLRRIAGNMIPVWKLKGSKEGIGLFIKEITTWDITNGTGNYSDAIQDTLPNVSALRFFDANLGTTNTRLTQTEPDVVPGGRFARGLPGIIIPGFFTFREFVITIPSVALFSGYTTTFSVSSNSTTMGDTEADFGPTNSLVGNYLLPNQEEVDDIFQIISNTPTTITVRGIITNKAVGGRYAVLSPLNASRFLVLNKLMPYYIPYGTRQSYDFV